MERKYFVENIAALLKANVENSVEFFFAKNGVIEENTPMRAL
jgi:hypothetical protein